MNIVMILPENLSADYREKNFAEALESKASNLGHTVTVRTAAKDNQNRKLEIMNLLKVESPDLVITINLAGFEYLTAMEELAYNMYAAHKAHLILHELPKALMDQFLSKRLNFSDIVYLPLGSSPDAYATAYPEVCFFEELPADTQGLTSDVAALLSKIGKELGLS